MIPCEPLNDLIFLTQRMEEDDSIIIKPDTHKKPTLVGDVIAVGPNVKDARIVEGAAVLMGKYAGSIVEVPLSGGREAEVRVVREEEILGIWTGE